MDGGNGTAAGDPTAGTPPAGEPGEGPAPADEPTPGWLARPSIWRPPLLGLLLAVSMLAPAAAILHLQRSTVFLGLFGTLGPLAQDWRLLRLRPSQRRRVLRVVATGRACGDRRLDELARDRLATVALHAFGGTGRTGRADQVTLLLVSGLPVLIAIAAAVLRSPWWLLAAMPGLAVMVMLWLRQARRADPWLRLQRLTTELERSR